MSYVTLRQFAALLEEAAEPAHADNSRRYLPTQGAALTVLCMVDGWIVYLWRSDREQAVLASDREPHKSRVFKTFDSAWRAIGEACNMANVARSEVRVS
jgi:hypothetical protein